MGITSAGNRNKNVIYKEILATLCKVFTFLTSLVSTKRLSIDISTPKVILTIFVPIYIFDFASITQLTRLLKGVNMNE